MNENILAFSSTATGYNHIKVEKGCEDASDFYMDDKMRICVVADGHGSDNYPRTERGSEYAVEAAIECIVDFVNTANPKDVLVDEKNHYALMMQLVTSILRIWHEKIENDYIKNPFTEKELERVSEKYKQRYMSLNENERKVEKAYGCTLIAYVCTDDYSFGMQIGDGKCVIVDKEGNFVEPIPWDENCQMNVTTSICDSDARDEFRFYISEKMPVAVFCGSDGIDDSYATPEEVYALYRSILKIFIEHGAEVGKKEIMEYLPVLTKRGSGDDVSVALIIDMEKVNILSGVLDTQGELFKIDAELKEKKHQIDVMIERRNAIDIRYRKWVQAGRPKLNTEPDYIVSNNMGVSIAEMEKEVAEITAKRQVILDTIQDELFDIEQASFAQQEELAPIDNLTNGNAVPEILVQEVEEKKEFVPLNVAEKKRSIAEQQELVSEQAIDEIVDEYLTFSSETEEINETDSTEEA